MNIIPWTEKYRPKTKKQMVGSNKILKPILIFLKKFEMKQKNNEKMGTKDKALLLIGPPGTGKTTSIHVIGREMGYDVREMNASDSRNKNDLRKIVGSANDNESLLFFIEKKESRLIFIDEVDGISGNEDKGGLTELLSLIEESSYPIILAANYRNKRISKIEEISKVLECEPPTTEEIVLLLEKIMKEENIVYEKEALIKIAKNSKGDYRSAINDVHTISKWGGSVKESTLTLDSHRDTIIPEDDMILNTLNALSIEDGLYYLESSDLQYKDLLIKIGDTLIQNDPSCEEMRVLIEANNLINHIQKESDYNLLGYFFKQIASIGIFRAEREAIMHINKPYWRSRKKESNEIVKKLQKYYPVRTEDIFEYVIPLLRVIFNKNTDYFQNFLAESNLTEKEWQEVASKI